MGFSLPTALASDQVNGVLWTLIAARNYLKRKKIDWVFAGGLVGFGLLGAYFGTKAVVLINPITLQRIVGLLIIFLVCFAFSRKQFGVEQRPPAANRFYSALLALPLGFYEAFFGSGNGLFTSALLTKTRGFDLTTALGYYYLIAFPWCILISSIYVQKGFGSLELIIPSCIGSTAGAILGSPIGSKKGSRFVKFLFIGLGSILGLKLALGM